MKLLLITIFLSISIFASCQSEFDFSLPNEIDLNSAEVLAVGDDLVTFRSKYDFEIWQFSQSKGKVINHFKMYNDFSKSFFEAFFKDNGYNFKITSDYFRKYDVNEGFVKFNNCFIDTNDDVYCMVQGNKIELAKSGNPDSALLVPFCAIVKIENEKISSILPIYLSAINKEYFVRNDADFFLYKGSFYLPVSKSNIANDSNYFLTKWEFLNNELVFKDFVPLNLPSYHVQSKINYGLLRFIFKKPNLMFYSCPTFYNLENNTHIDFEGANALSFDAMSLSKGSTFSIDFSICDFYVNENKILNILVRRYKKIYILKYNLESSKLISSQEITEFNSISDLYRFPFYSSNGNVILVKRGSNKISFLK